MAMFGQMDDYLNQLIEKIQTPCMFDRSMDELLFHDLI